MNIEDIAELFLHGIAEVYEMRPNGDLELWVGHSTLNRSNEVHEIPYWLTVAKNNGQYIVPDVNIGDAAYLFRLKEPVPIDYAIECIYNAQTIQSELIEGCKAPVLSYEEWVNKANDAYYGGTSFPFTNSAKVRHESRGVNFHAIINAMIKAATHLPKSGKQLRHVAGWVCFRGDGTGSVFIRQNENAWCQCLAEWGNAKSLRDYVWHALNFNSVNQWAQNARDGLYTETIKKVGPVWKP